MPNDTPDDMQIALPEEAQEAEYARATWEQVSQLGARRPGVTAYPNLDWILWARHQETDGALKLDILRGQTGGSVLVVSRELLFPKHDDRDEAVAVLTSRNSDNVQWGRRVPAEDEPPCQELDDAVWVYRLEGGTDREAGAEVTRALASLRDSKKDAGASIHGLAATQMVHKSAGGPAPVTTLAGPVDGTHAPDEGPEGQITVAVIDTGIDEYNERADGFLNEVRRGNNNVDQLDVIAAVAGPGMPPVLDLAAGHGTFAAGIIRQVDPQARIVVYRALDTDGVGTERDVACAMIRAAEDRAQVISLSLGVEAVDGVVPPYLRAAVEHIRSHFDPPPAIVAAAGNGENEKPVYPAALDWVVAVAALQAVDPASGKSPGGAWWSSRGAWVTCSAVGEGIVSTFVEGEEDPQFGSDRYLRDAWALWSGTSFAAPQVAALIARKCRDGMSPQDAVDALFPTTNRPADGYGTRVELLKGTKPAP
jgi:hypothetical protein